MNPLGSTALFALLAVLFSLAHSLIKGEASQQSSSVSPAWSVNLHTALTGTPVGVVGGSSEQVGKPASSLWFVDDRTIVVSFVTQQATANPGLSRRGARDDSLPFRLETLFLDATLGKVKVTEAWPVSSRASSIVATHGGRLVALTGDELVLYSADQKELNSLRLPATNLMYTAQAAGHVSPSGKTILFLSSWVARKSATWVWIDTDNLQLIRSWEEVPRGPVSISDSKIAMVACASRLQNCLPGIDVRTPDTDWKTIAPIENPRHPPAAAFVDDDELFAVDHSAARLFGADSTQAFTEKWTHQGCWWGGIYTSSGGRRFIVPSCRLRGHADFLDLGGYDELEQLLVYDAPFHQPPYALAVKGAKIRELTYLALSPDGSRLAALNDESLYVFQLPQAE